MRILVSLNLLLVLIAIGIVLLIREHHVQVDYGLDEVLHWSPVGENTAPVVLPLENSRAGSDYRLQLRLVGSDAERYSRSLVHIQGQDQEGNVFKVFSGEPVYNAGGGAAVITIEVLDDGVSYVALEFDADLRSQVSLVGVGASTADIKARSVDASITRNSTRILVVILAAMLLLQIVSLLFLILRNPTQRLTDNEAGLGRKLSVRAATK